MYLFQNISFSSYTYNVVLQKTGSAVCNGLIYCCCCLNLLWDKIKHLTMVKNILLLLLGVHDGTQCHRCSH